MPFTLKRDRWYACEFIGDEFTRDCCSYSPIRVLNVRADRSEPGILELAFYHANYPEGVRDKTYQLVILERGERLLLARSQRHTPARYLQIYAIDWDWMTRHFCTPTMPVDIQHWLGDTAW